MGGGWLWWWWWLVGDVWFIAKRNDKFCKASHSYTYFYFAHIRYSVWGWDEHTIRIFAWHFGPVASIIAMNAYMALHVCVVCIDVCLIVCASRKHNYCSRWSIFLWSWMVRYIQVGDRKLRIKCGKWRGIIAIDGLEGVVEVVAVDVNLWMLR